jgi:peptidoglycan/xylan/chitin deacetylase (PgdA/CDA1 family)
MKIVYLGTISTGIVLLLGMVMILPPFLQPEPKQEVLLSFSIAKDEDLSQWCDNIASVLYENKVKAAVFITGEAAEKSPNCITSFPNDIDIGSQGFYYSPITEISAYSLQLDEIQKGKNTIEKIGNLESKLFKAPYGKTDENIYSLLSRSDILADFSYEGQFNKFHENQFIWFKIKSYDTTNYSNSLTPVISNVESKGNQIPIVINFDDNNSVDEIKTVLVDLNSKEFEFVNASDLVGYELTKRNQMPEGSI